MPRHIIYTRASRHEVRALAALIPAVMAGRVADPLGIRHGFSMRLAHAFLSKIKEAFIVKARGGTDECGIRWPPLSKKYLAYQRGPKSDRTAGKLAPGGKDGFMSPAQLKKWRWLYAQQLTFFLATMDEGEAKRRAAALAWSQMKREGVKTKLAVFGSRKHDILLDRGILFNSLLPGVLNTAGADAAYTPPANQAVRDAPGELVVGTTVEYAAYHQGTEAAPGRRRFFPRASEIPEAWWSDFRETAGRGLVAAVLQLAKGLAA